MSDGPTQMARDIAAGVYKPPVCGTCAHRGAWGACVLYSFGVPATATACPDYRARHADDVKENEK